MNFFRRLRSQFHKKELDKDLSEELAFHIEQETEENIAAGMSAEEARYAALRSFGGVDQVKEECRDAWGVRFIDTLLQDIRFGLCLLAKNRGFTAVAVLTLALGIGGTTAIFTVVYSALLNPWPYADSGRLAVLVAHDKNRIEYSNFTCSNPSEFLDYQEQNHVFDQVIGGVGENVVLTGRDAPASWPGMWVTPNTFQVLGVPPLVGRVITPDDSKPAAPPVVVLSYKVWQREFGGDPGIVGRTLVLNRQPTTVIGVMPPRFKWYGGGGFESWFPASFSRGDPNNQWHPTPVVGHLKPGVTIAEASADLELLARRFASAYPLYHRTGRTFSVKSLTEAFVEKQSRTTMSILMGGVGLLLLIACVNVANLLLARATARAKEISIRAALGAGRSRLVRQLMIESLLLAVGGAALGCVVAWNGLDALVAIIPPFRYIPDEAVIRFNVSVLLFTVGVVLVSTLLFGLAPALLAVRRDLHELLKASGRGAGESIGHGRLRNLLVVSEVALSLVLLTGAGLMIRSFFSLRHVETGYNPDHVLVAGTDLPEQRYKTAEQRNQFCLEVLRRVRALPGVVSAAFGDPGPLDYGFGSTPIEIAGDTSAERRSAWVRLSSDSFFETLGIRLLRGRTISEEDMLHARKVAIVNRAFVTEHFGDENPLGQQIRTMEPAETKVPPVQQPWFEIVGVVADSKYNPEAPTQPAIYIPYGVGGYPEYSNLFVQTAAEPRILTNQLRREVAALDKEMPLDWSTLREDLSRDWFAEPRFVLTLMAAFASLGLILVSVGVYSILSYAISQRTHEIGVRMALGADATDVRRMVLKSGMLWLAVGIGFGVPASIALAKVLQNRIWGIKSADPLTLVAVSLVLTAVGLAACYLPARRATKVDPMVALRHE